LERLTEALAERYAVEREIGRGGMATVFLAEDLKHHRKVAIKVLHPELASSVGPDRFLREVETVAGLTHPHVLPLFDSGEAEGLLFYTMPHVDGESLRQRLERESQLSVEAATQIALEVADALDHAHANSVIHRDIKLAISCCRRAMHSSQILVWPVPSTKQAGRRQRPLACRWERRPT
jgi:serine/threonine-protein kinase